MEKCSAFTWILVCSTTKHPYYCLHIMVVFTASVKLVNKEKMYYQMNKHCNTVYATSSSSLSEYSNSDSEVHD